VPLPLWVEHGHIRVRARLQRPFRQPEQPGDVPQTWASIDKAAELLGYQPKTPFSAGIDRFCTWLGESCVAATDGGRL